MYKEWEDNNKKNIILIVLFLILIVLLVIYILSFKNNKIHIILDIVNLDKHFVIYLVKLLDTLVNKYVSNNK